MKLIRSSYVMGMCAATTALLSLGCGNAVLAADGNNNGLIDKPFEQAVIKHFETRFFNRVGATAEQKKEMTAIIAKGADESMPVREQLRAKLIELNKLMAQNNATDDEITAKAHEVRALRNQVADHRLKTALAIRSVLTPEQRQQISNRVAGVIGGQWKSNFTQVQ